jgi:hypothetical protein
MAEVFYVAELGMGSNDIIQKYAEKIEVLGALFNAVEVFDSPFDAVRALNKTTKLMPEHHVTIYKTIGEYSSVTISNNSESRILATSDILNFEKYHTLALGSLIYSL